MVNQKIKDCLEYQRKGYCWGKKGFNQMFTWIKQAIKENFYNELTQHYGSHYTAKQKVNLGIVYYLDQLINNWDKIKGTNKYKFIEFLESRKESVLDNVRKTHIEKFLSRIKTQN